MDRLIRSVLCRLMIALVAISLASAPLHATVGPAPGMFVGEVQTTQTGQSQPDYRYGIPSKSHAAGQGCCHLGCIMAVLPPLTGAMHALPLSEIVPILPDLMPVAAMRSGIDHPPKRA